MAIFRYRMQNILNIKYKLEEQEKLLFAQAQAEVYREEAALSLLSERRAEYEQMLREQELTERRLNVQEIRRLRDGVQTLSFHMSEQKKRVLTAKQKVEQALGRLTEAMMERKIQEKLREKALAEFLKEEERSERQSIDELISYQFGSARTEGGSVQNGEEKEG